MIPDWQCNKVYVSEKLKDKFPNTYNKLSETLAGFAYQLFTLPYTADIWARDYMPVQVDDQTFIEYRYDPDYLQNNSEQGRAIKTYPDIVCEALDLKTQKSKLIIDGGNIVKSENAVILTDKIFEENILHFSKSEVKYLLQAIFINDKVIIIPRDKGCEFGHADGMLRFINNDKVLISGVYEYINKSLNKALLKALQDASLAYDWLKVSDKENEDHIAYINFLQTKDFIIVPALNIPEDDVALAEIGKHFPEYQKKNRIVKMDMREIFQHSGALNCITWTIKA